MEKRHQKTAIRGGGTAARSLPVRWPAQAHISIYKGSQKEHCKEIGFEYRVGAVFKLKL